MNIHTHAQTPWRRHDMEVGVIVGSDNKSVALVDGRFRTEAEDAANIALIIEAVNSHADKSLRIAELVEALAELRDRTSCTQGQYEIIDRALAAQPIQ